MLEVELHVDRGGLALRGLGDDRHLFALRSAFERVAQPEQTGGDDAAHRAPPETVDGSFRSVLTVNVVGGIALGIDLVHTTTVPTRCRGSRRDQISRQPGRVALLHSASMPSLDDLPALLEPEQHLAVVATTRREGGVQASVVNVGVLRHPQRTEDVVAFVARGGAVKLRHLRRDPRVTIVARSGWLWVAVEGHAEIIGPDDIVPSFDSEELPELLRDVFRAAGGTHDNWAEYDQAMLEDRRAAVLVSPDRIYSNAGGS